MIPRRSSWALVSPPRSPAPIRFPSPEAISSLGCRSRLSLLRWDAQCSHGSNKAKGGERRQYDDLSHEYFPRPRYPTRDGPQCSRMLPQPRPSVFRAGTRVAAAGRKTHQPPWRSAFAARRRYASLIRLEPFSPCP